MGNIHNDFSGWAHNVVQAQAVHFHFHVRPANVEGKAPIGFAPPCSNLPPRNRNFVGRRHYLDQLYGRLNQGQASIVVIRGLGGTGKSELALEFAHANSAASTYKITWWVRADSHISIVEDLASLALELGMPPQQDMEKMAKEALKSLGKRSDWLLIYDNANSSKDIAPALPGSNGHVLATSRKRDWSRIATCIDLTSFKRTESVALINSRTSRNENEAADALAHELEDLPLAIAQAASYIDIRDISVSRYRELYNAGKIEMLDRGLESHEYPKSVATTWLLHIDDLAMAHPEALDLLRLCAFFAPERIPISLILSNTALLPDRLSDAAISQIDQEDLISHLTQIHLFTSIDSHNVKVHRLVQAVTRHELEYSESIRWTFYAASMLHLLLTDQVDKLSSEWRQLAVHAEAVASYIEEHFNYDSRTVSLIRFLALMLKFPPLAKSLTELEERSHDWQGEAAAQFRSYALDSAETTLRMLDVKESRPLAFLIIAQLHEAVGEHSKYRRSLERALEIAEDNLGADHLLATGIRELIARDDAGLNGAG